MGKFVTGFPHFLSIKKVDVVTDTSTANNMHNLTEGTLLNVNI